MYVIIMFCLFIFVSVQGIFSSGLGYYLAGVVINAKGPVFLTAFSPLSLVIVAIMSSFIFAEQMRVGM